MKAVVHTEYGPPEVLHVEEVPKPDPKENELLVRVRAVSVNYGDLVARKWKHVSPGEFHMPFLFWLMAKISFGLSKPRNPILGSEFAGDVEAVGIKVTNFKPGDQVFGYRGQSMRADAEYVCIAASGTVAPKPANMSYEQAAVTPYGAITALNLLGRVNIQPGQKVLINGASGSIGAAAVQLARHYGAEVTGVCSTPRVAFVKALGAEEVIDYTKEDFTQNGQTYDVIFDILGKSSFSRCKNSLKPNGRYLLASFKMKQLLQMVLTSITGDKKVICALAPERQEDLLTIKKLVEEGKITTNIDRRFPLEQAAAAHRYIEEGHKKGQVVLTVNGGD